MKQTSRSSIAAFDIETIPDLGAMDALPEPEAAKNIKDPEKIKADIAKKKAAQADKLALSPWTGRVCAYALECDNAELVACGAVETLDVDNERELIEEVFYMLGKLDVLVTYNGIGFDIPFLYTRAMLLDINPKLITKKFDEMTRRYQLHPHIDLMQVLSGWNSQRFTKLDLVAQRMFGEGKTEREYSEYRQAIEDGFSDAIRQDVKNDADLTWRIYQRCQGFIL